MRTLLTGIWTASFTRLHQWVVWGTIRILVTLLVLAVPFGATAQSLFVGDNQGGGIREFDTTGTFVGVLGTTAVNVGSPQALACSAAGNLFVADPA